MRIGHREVATGRFREDLLYRLNTVHVTVPPLRNRRDDIPLFAAHFAADCAARFDRPGWTLPDEAIRRFMEHSWPGNVRELRQTVLRIASFEDRLEEILDELTAVRPLTEPVAVAFAATAGHYGRAAALLGISAKTMTRLAAEACPEQPATRGRRRRKPLPR